jgi:uncharacterized membrane protein YphA (DoxX/SURF4 family)
VGPDVFIGILHAWRAILVLSLPGTILVEVVGGLLILCEVFVPLASVL